MMVSGGRNGVDYLSRILRSDFVQFNNQDGTPLGVNFDLDDGKDPVVRDGILFFVDENETALLYTKDEKAKPVTAGFDDSDGDGQADVVGIGMVIQDDDADGAQDFVDLDFDGKPDDLDYDGKGDLMPQTSTVSNSSPKILPQWQLIKMETE
jgi:hypothetical protein